MPEWGRAVDEIVAAHLQEVAIIEPLLACEDRLHRRLHFVVDAPPAVALKLIWGSVALSYSYFAI